MTQTPKKQPAGQRVFLFLQGHPSSFACKLAEGLVACGGKVLKINLCLGDTLYWRGHKADSYRGRFKNWEAYLQDYITDHKVTDILYYGDRRPYHVVASRLADKMGIMAFAYEFGYLRPDWITIERNGMSAYSHFPNDPEHIRRIASQYDTPDMRRLYPYDKDTEIFHETLYNFATFLLPFAYPFYHADRYYNLLLEYASGIPKSFSEKQEQKRAQAIIETLVKNKKKFFLFPLQLQSDYQLRDNAPFDHQGEAIDLAIESFAKYASPETLLIFKQHPLDNHLENWPRHIEKSACRYKVESRIKMLVGGNLDTLLDHAKGCILINSTVGLHAILAHCPVKVLGKALYDIEGICDKGSLDKFWSDPFMPDPDMTSDLVKALAGTIQVKGNFFTKEGQDVAVPAMVQMIMENRVNRGEAYIDPPPRLP